LRAGQPLFIGIMSGTSADGIDVAIVRFDSSVNPALVGFFESPMPKKLSEPILRLAAPGLNEVDRMGELDRALAIAYADAVRAALQDAGMKPSDIAAIGCHGQTIRHRPGAEYPFTIQIGCAATLAEQTGITVVSDFRSRDIAAGGEGAPLVPFAHWQLFGQDNDNTAVLNIGGIANITWLGCNNEITGFDIGPGNMVMDALMLSISGGKHGFDENGQLAASGSVCPPLLDQLMQHPFLLRTPPKSTGREEFGKALVNTIMRWPDISEADRMATACQLTVASIKNSIRFLPEAPARWLCCGGGVRNIQLMKQLEKELAPSIIDTTEAAGIPPQAVEAVSFALLARQSLMGKPNTIPQVTGASHAVCGGQITPGHNWQELLQDIPAWIR